jgi:Domain of unknown function (DUF222)
VADGMTTAERGEWLVAVLAEAEAAQAEWLLALADFDAAQGWALDGQLSCADWLIWRARMSRSTAYEKLQVARALRRRSVLREAFTSGRISYSATRAMARMDCPDEAVDEALVAVAESGTVRDVERVVAAYLRLEEQERRPRDLSQLRGVAVRPHYDGLATIEITLEEVEVADFMAALEALMELHDPAPDVDGPEDEAGSPANRNTADDLVQSARADWREVRTPTWQELRADAFMEMMRTAIKHADSGQATGEDRFLVHVVSSGDGMKLLDGTVLDQATAARLSCDSSSTRLLLGPDWEPLAMGRKTRDWTTAQRRAVMIRDGGECRFPGCGHYRVDVHHHIPWEHDGETNVANGYCACPRHHSLIHAGWTVTGDPNSELVFHRPDGSVLGISRPRLRRRAPVHT